ncbi:hypothetical protein [Bradymonas sediminis]|nr:hypothetical protein [Bradymonas sediminis]
MSKTNLSYQGVAAFCAMSLLLIACEQQPNPAEPNADEALKARLEAAASKRTKRASMSFGFIHKLDGIPDGGPVALELGDGTKVEVQQAYLVVSAIEAHLCEPGAGDTPTQNAPQGADLGAPAKPGIPKLLGHLSDWLIAPAYAHVPSSATRLGTPFVEDLLAPGQARIIDEIAPPMATYCTLYAVVAPADDDVVNLTNLATAEIEGKTLLLRGRYRLAADDEAEWQAFESASEARDIIQVDAVDPQTGASPLNLDSANASRMMLLDKRVSPDLFEGLAREDFDGAAAADQVLKRLEARFKIYQYERK